MKEYGIYLITNKINGKKYVGSTGSTQGFERRWYLHNRDLRLQKHQNNHLQNAYNKYGKDALEFTIVCNCSDENLAEMEDYYIRCWDTIDRRYGYNIREAGDKGRMSAETKLKISIANKGRLSGVKNPFYGKTHSEETKKIISDMRLRTPTSQETIDKLKLMRKGRTPAKGMIHTEEAKLKMSIARKGVPKSEEHKRKISESNMGKQGSWVDKKHSEETKLKMSETNKKRWQLRKSTF